MVSSGGKHLCFLGSWKRVDAGRGEEAEEQALLRSNFWQRAPQRGLGSACDAHSSGELINK